MTIIDEPSPYDAQLALSATGMLAEFNNAGVLSAADVQVASTLGRLADETDQRVLLAVALCVRTVREGSVCIDLHDARGLADAEAETTLAWPAVDEWYDALRASPLLGVGSDGDPSRPVRLIDDLLYLDRYWRQEELVRKELAARAERPVRALDLDTLRSSLEAVYRDPAPNHQRLAAAAAALGAVTIVTGGPGTGKTTTIKQLIDVLNATWPTPPRIAFAAPTAKAAARLAEAVGKPASTVHRLLGSRPGSHTRFRHGATNRLPYDVVVVDETSMVSLTLMSRLLEALRPEASLVLVGDPDQLASVEAGAVLGDLVHRPPRPGADPRLDVLTTLLPDDLSPAAEVAAELRGDVIRLRDARRYGKDIAAVADAIRRGNADDVLAALDDNDAVHLVETADAALRTDVQEAGQALVEAARAGDVGAALAAMDRHRVICGHRRGPYGVRQWGERVEQWIADAVDDYELGGEWYAGRPLIATSNDYELQLFNGETGVVVDRGDDGLRAVFGRGSTPLELPINRLSDVETVHALTVHRAQGSQFDRVTVVLPPPDSPLLTRELLYTALTRTQSFVRIIGTPEAVRTAVERPIRRASGLQRSPAGLD